MINVDILDVYTSNMELHPQVLIKLKQHALGNHISNGLNFSEENTTEDYYEDAALIFNHMLQKVDHLTSEEQFEELWMNFTGTEPVKWQPFENYTWAKLWAMIVEEYHNLKNLAESVIALQNLGPVQGLLKDV
jgi:hypothetical protein